jgi:circadian clock protein KaiC
MVVLRGTVMGEPPIKMLRHQQQLAFFDPSKVGVSIHFADLTELVFEQGLGAVLEQIVQQVEAMNPRIVVVDSFQAAVRATARLRLAQWICKALRNAWRPT